MKKEKKKLEFAQKGMIVGFIIGTLMVVAYYGLKFYAMKLSSMCGYNIDGPDSALAIAGVSDIIGTFMAYVAYQATLKTSRNKYGIDAMGNPFTMLLENAMKIPSGTLEGTQETIQEEMIAPVESGGEG